MQLSFIVWLLQHGRHEDILFSGFISIFKYSEIRLSSKSYAFLMPNTPKLYTTKAEVTLFFSIFIYLRLY